MINIEVFATTEKYSLKKRPNKTIMKTGAFLNLEDYEDYNAFIIALDKAFEKNGVNYDKFEDLLFYPAVFQINETEYPLHHLENAIDGSFLDADLFYLIHDTSDTHDKLADDLTQSRKEYVF